MRQNLCGKTESEAQPPTAPPDFHFAGFKNLNSTPIPDEFFDVLAVRLSEAELRVLLYIMRRTFGFKKKADAISLSQLTGGIRKRDGTILDHGTGLSKPAVLKAVNGLQAKGIITIEKRTGYDGRNEVNVYQLRFLEENSPRSSDFYSPGYSVIEYCSDEYTGQPTSNLIPTSNLPVAPEQKQPAEPVNQAYHPGKPTLPREITTHTNGKASLPIGVKSINQRGKNQEARVVNQINKQHDSFQDSRKQDTVQQQLLCAEGALALQKSAEEPITAPASVSFYQLIAALMELGLSEKLAKELLATYPAAYLWEKIAFTRQQLGRNPHQAAIRNTAGYLRRAIEQDYRPERNQSQPVAPDQAFARRFPVALALLSRSHAQPEEEEPYQEEEEDTPAAAYPSSTNADAIYSQIWAEVCEDLAGRYRLGAAMSLLEGSQLYLVETSNRERQAIIQLRSPWQERELGLAARTTIGLALRQQLGPGYTVTFESV